MPNETRWAVQQTPFNNVQTPDAGWCGMDFGRCMEYFAGAAVFSAVISLPSVSSYPAVMLVTGTCSSLSPCDKAWSRCEQVVTQSSVMASGIKWLLTDAGLTGRQCAFLLLLRNLMLELTLSIQCTLGGPFFLFFSVLETDVFPCRIHEVAVSLHQSNMLFKTWNNCRGMSQCWWTRV